MKLDYEIINFVYPSVSLDLLMWSMFFFFFIVLASSLDSFVMPMCICLWVRYVNIYLYVNSCNFLNPYASVIDLKKAKKEAFDLVLTYFLFRAPSDANIISFIHFFSYIFAKYIYFNIYILLLRLVVEFVYFQLVFDIILALSLKVWLFACILHES